MERAESHLRPNKHMVHPDERMKNFVDVLDELATKPPAQDERIGAFAQALRQGIDQPGALKDFFSEVIALHPEIGPSHLATKTLRAAQNQLYRQYPGYPRNFLRPAQWRDGLEWILEDFDRAGQFTVDVWTRPLQSNVSERYKGIKAFVELARQFGRIGMLNIIDVGCSQNAGLNHLASGIGFKPPSLIRPGSPLRLPSLRHTAAFSTILQRPLEMNLGIGIDRYSPADSRAWAWSCSFYPSELLDDERVAMFEALIMAEYPNVQFQRGDFAELDRSVITTRFKDFSADIVGFSTVLYQANEEERAAMLKNAEYYAREFIVVQDFLSIDPHDSSRLIFRNKWQDKAEPYPYRMVVRDMRNGHAWHEIFRWTDGRCRELTIGMGRIAINNRVSRSIWQGIDAHARG